MMGIPTIKGLPWYFAAEAQNFDLVPGCCPWFGLQEIHDVNLGGSKKMAILVVKAVAIVK